MAIKLTKSGTEEFAANLSLYYGIFGFFIKTEIPISFHFYRFGILVFANSLVFGSVSVYRTALLHRVLSNVRLKLCAFYLNHVDF